MERIYFSRNNFNVIYNIIGSKLYEQYAYDIGNDNRFEKEVVNILKSVFQQKDTFKIDTRNISDEQYSNELSKQVLGIAMNYFSKYIENNNLGNKKTTKQSKLNKHKGDNKKLQVNSIHRDLETNNWSYLYNNPQEHTELVFDNNLSTRILEKDNYVPEFPCIN